MRYIPRSVFPVVAAITILVIAFASGFLQPLENAFLDSRAAWFARTPSNDVVIVEIDARTLRALDRWPWSRSIHAALIERLNEAKPRAVFFDVDFSVRSGDPAADLALASALSERDYPFVLPAFWQQLGAGAAGGYVLTQPLPQLAMHTSVGLVDLAPSPDGLVRNVVHSDRFQGADYASAASQLAAVRHVLHRFETGVAYPLDFAISPAAFKHVSYLDVLDGYTQELTGKTVFVGATAIELGDTVPVPVHRSLPGVVTQALAYATLLDGSPINLSPWIGVAFGALVCFVIPLLRTVSWRRTVAVVVAIAVVALLAVTLLDVLAKVRVDVMPLLFAAVLSALIGIGLSADRDALRALLTGARLERREALISSVLSASIDGIIVFGRDGVVRDANRASARLLGHTLDNLQGENVRRLLPGLPEVEALGATWSQTSRGREPQGNRFELSIGSADSLVPVEVSITRVTVAARTWYTAIIRDITERKQQQALLKHQATHDALTGLPNRVLLGRALEAMSASTPTALFMLDLDRFKDVNDTLGHATGDAVLTILGQRLRSALPEQNLIARIGGDEFAVVVPSYTDVAELRALADIVLERVQSPVQTGTNTIEVGASIGIALCPDHGTDGGVLLQRADVAMYVAKNNRTSVEFYSVEADHSSIRHLKMTGALRAAIANDELELFYQPKVRLSDLKCVGVEALARWTHRELGAVSPGEFVPLAEESNLIVPLTRWAVLRALEDHAAWRTAGLDLDLAVNLSARHLRDPAFAEEVLKAIEQQGVDPRHVELEITETALMSDPEKAMEVLQILTRAGVRVAMDDFGTGFSSLAYLKHLNLHTLKIDRCFIKDMTNNPNDLTIVRSTLRMAHSLELSVVAEGIEERAHYEMLRDLGCDVGQGYWIAKPMPADRLLAWSEAWERGRPLQQHAGVQAAG